MKKSHMIKLKNLPNAPKVQFSLESIALFTKTIYLAQLTKEIRIPSSLHVLHEQVCQGIHLIFM